MIEFTPWPKIARLNRDITITEKIDGTNGAVGVLDLNATSTDEAVDDRATLVPAARVDGRYLVYAQSRKKLITPSTDSHGFARWVWDNADALAKVLGPGIHFGEWWGAGIQRGYGLPKGEKRYSLFNTKRWGDQAMSLAMAVPELRVVPVLYDGPFGDQLHYYHPGREIYPLSPWEWALEELRTNGSHAVEPSSFHNPEGIVLYHKAANMMFKVTLENDEVPKFLQERGVEE